MPRSSAIEVGSIGRRVRRVGMAAFVAAAVCLSCGRSEPLVDPGESLGQPLDTLYREGVVWTGIVGQPDATAFGVRDGIVEYVGDGAGAPAAKETIDLQGRFVMHGFIDNHVHFFEGGMALSSVDLRDAATPSDFTERIVDYARELPEGRWVLSGNWDHEQWGGELPHWNWIDHGTGDRPVFVIRLDGHMGLANTAALRLAGIDSKTPSPAGGEIVRDSDGIATGILKDNAMNLMWAVIPSATSEELLESFERAQAHALSLGLTQVHAVTANATETWMLDALQLAHGRGLMKLRVYALTPLEQWTEAADFLDGQGQGDELLRWGGVKGFVDGSLGSATAWFHDPYDDEPANRGFPLSDMEVLKEQIEGADARGLNLAIHAIGDRAIDELIDAFVAVGGPDIGKKRYRIEHFQHPTREAIEKLAQHGIVAAMHPYHAIDDGRWAEKKIGSGRAGTTYPFRSILDAGGFLTFGSDWPVAPLNPLQGVYAAVTRRTTDGANPDGWQPHERITVEEALRAYTVDSAYAGFEEGRAGTLQPGMRADFVVLSDDPRSVDPEALLEIEVSRTVVGGQTVYRHGESLSPAGG